MKISATRILVDGQWQENAMLTINEGSISALGLSSDEVDVHLQGSLVPGLIDVQVNGGGGCLFNADPTLETIMAIQSAHQRYGTTSMLPTLITDEYPVMVAAAAAMMEAIEQKTRGIIGIHFEGPFISQERKGVHKSDFIRQPTDAELALFTRKDLGVVMLTVAPEHFPVDVIRDLTSHGVKICLGHSAATFEQAQEAIDAGATGFTHIFNAMSPMTSREPGMVGAALANRHTYAGLVLDHFHVHPISSKVAVQTKGADHMMLVTDAMAHVGTNDKQLPFFDTQIQREDDKLTTPDGTLAGSCLDMASAVRNAHLDLGVSLPEAIMMGSTAPAAFLGMQHQLGKIDVGQQANFLLLDDRLQVKQVYIDGVQVHAA